MKKIFVVAVGIAFIFGPALVGILSGASNYAAAGLLWIFVGALFLAGVSHDQQI